MRPHAPMLALALGLLAAAALPQACAATCQTKLTWAAEAQAYAKPVRVKFTGYPMLPLRSENRGTVSGAVTVTMPAVNGACPSTVDPQDDALQAAIAAATINTTEPLKITNVTGKIGSLTGWYYVHYSVYDLQVAVSSGAVGGKVNKRKSIGDMSFKVVKGLVDIYYQTNWRGEFWSESLVLDIAKSGVQASGCSLTARKSSSDWYLNCNTLKAAFDKITSKEWDMDVYITVRGKGLTASAPFSTSALVA